MVPKRGKNKIQVDYTIKDMYKFYKNKLCPLSIKRGYNLSQKEYHSIFKSVMADLIHEMMHDNLEVKLPSNMGTLSIIKKKLKVKLKEDGTIDERGMSIDFKSTNQLWAEDPEAKAKKIIIRFYNDHTNGYKYNFQWRRIPNLKNKTRFAFVASRSNKRTLAALLKDDDFTGDFYEVKNEYLRK